MKKFVPRLEQWFKRCCIDETYITRSTKSMTERTQTNKSDKSIYTYASKLGNSVHGQEQAPTNGMPHQPQLHLAVPESGEGMRAVRHARSVSGNRSDITLDATSTFSARSNRAFSEYPSGRITAATTISRDANEEGPPLARKPADQAERRNDIPSRPSKESRAYCGFAQGLGRVINYFFHSSR